MVVKKQQPATNAQGTYHTRICGECDGLGWVTRVVGPGRATAVKCGKCLGKGGK